MKTRIKEIAGQYYFRCPGCDMIHGVGRGWEFNGDFEKPTFSPSILVRGGDIHCHSFVKNGMIQFLGDCHHEMRGKTIELPET